MSDAGTGTDVFTMRLLLSAVLLKGQPGTSTGIDMMIRLFLLWRRNQGELQRYMLYASSQVAAQIRYIVKEI